MDNDGIKEYPADGPAEFEGSQDVSDSGAGGTGDQGNGEGESRN